MNSRKISPYLMSGFITAVGLFFIVTGFIGPTFLKLQAPRGYFLLGLSIFFIFAGASTAYLTHRGALKKVGITNYEVRLETISKSNDKQFLAKTALDDDNKEVREAAADRLKEIEA